MSQDQFHQPTNEAHGQTHDRSILELFEVLVGPSGLWSAGSNALALDDVVRAKRVLHKQGAAILGLQADDPAFHVGRRDLRTFRWTGRR